MSNARVKNYVFELIRLNYISSYNFTNAKFKQLLTENLILKYFTSIVLSIDNQENLNMMSILIIEICFYTQDIKFFDKILIRILDLHNHFKEFLQETDKYNLICKFQKNTFIYLFNKLSSSFQSEKLQIFIKKIYSITKIDFKDNSLLKILLNFLKTFIINKDYEIFVDKNFCYKLNRLPSQVVLNFLAPKNKNSKKIYENMKSKKINIYEPYLYLKHNKIFEFLIEVLKSDLTNTYIGEEILELFLIYTKNIFFFKCIPNEILLKIIHDEENLKKYLTNKKFFELLLSIISVSPFNYNTFAGQAPLNAKNIIKTSYEFFKKDITKKILSEIISMHSDKLKDKMLELSLNTLKDILKSMKNISANYKKSLTNQLNRKDLPYNASSNSNANSANFIQQNIFIGINNANSSNASLHGTQLGSNALFQNTIVFFNPKEKIINLNLMTESNTKEDNIGNYKDANNRSQVNFKNCKQFMNKILVLLRIYMQSYFQIYMSSALNDYLKVTGSNSNASNLNSFASNQIKIANAANTANNQLNALLSSLNNPNFISALLQLNNLGLLNVSSLVGNNLSSSSNNNNNNNLNFFLAGLSNLQGISNMQHNNQINSGLNYNQNLNSIANNINLSPNSVQSNSPLNMFNNTLPNGNYNYNLITNNNNNNNNNLNYQNNSFCYSPLANNLSSSPVNNSFSQPNNQTLNQASGFINQNINGISRLLNTNMQANSMLPSNTNFNNFSFNNNSYSNNYMQNQDLSTSQKNLLNLSSKILNNQNNFYNLESSGKEPQSGLSLGEAEKMKHLSAFYSSFLDSLYDMRNLAYFKPSVAVSVLYTLFSLKDVLSKFGDELILKTIYLVLSIGWSQYEGEIYKIFNENFNLKFKKFEYEKIRSFETLLKKEFINFLSDVVVFSLVDKISIGHNILATFNAIFKNKTSRECIFLDICRWNVVSKSIRDNMKNEYRNKMQENSQVFIGNK